MVKIAIKFGILIVVLVVMFLAFNLFVKKAVEERIVNVNGQIAQNNYIKFGLETLLQHKDSWQPILKSQRRDFEFIRAVLPEAPFPQKVYLRTLQDVFYKSGVYSSGLRIIPVQAPRTRVNYVQFFTVDPLTFATNVQKFAAAFEYLNGTDSVGGQELKRRDSLILKPGYTAEQLELALWYSFRFNQMMSVNMPEGINLLPGFEMHRFDTTVSGTYNDIKRFLWTVKNMRPHTVIVNWHLSPGKGNGEGRLYTASLSFFTFVDTNTPPTYEVVLDPRYPDLPNQEDVMNLMTALGL